MSDTFDKLSVTLSPPKGERVEDFVRRCRRAVIEVEDPAELRRQLTAMIEAEFPVAKPVFTPGETLPMHAFLARFERDICGGVVPSFYDRPVTVVDAGGETILVAIRSDNPKSEIQNPK